MTTQRIGSTVFTWDPDEMDIPESKKTVSTVPTYSGSAIFQWDAFLEGTTVTLKWHFMPVAQYNELRTKYLTTDTYEWVLRRGNSYNVKIVDLNAKYQEVLFEDLAYRMDVELVLNIRSAASTTTTTTTTSTSTSTTTTAP